MMISTRARIALATPLMLGALALVGCTAAPDADDNGAAEAAAAKFVACLLGQDQTAKILDDGQVGVLLPEGVDQTGPGIGEQFDNTTEDGGDGDQPGLVGIMMDENGDTWIASSSAGGLPEEGGIRDAWLACEEEVPDFEQPQPDMSGADVQTFSIEDQIEASLAFAECARENGYADFADPDEHGQLTFPLVSEDEFRGLLDACITDSDQPGLPISQESIESFDFDWMAILGEYFEGGPTMVGRVGGDDE